MLNGRTIQAVTCSASGATILNESVPLLFQRNRNTSSGERK